MHRASGTKTVSFVSIPGRVKPKIRMIGIHVFLLDVQQLKGHCEVSTVYVDRWAGGSLTQDQKVSLLSPDQGNLVNKM